MKTKLIFIMLLFLALAVSYNDMDSRFIGLLVLTIASITAIVLSLKKIQIMSGVSWEESGRRARELLRQAEDGDLPVDYQETRDYYYEPTQYD